MVTQASEYDHGEKETLILCSILACESASQPLNESAIHKLYEKVLKKKKTKQSADRYVARVTSTQIAFESIEKAKKQGPIMLADLNDIGRNPTDANIFSLQVQGGWKTEKKKKKKKEDKLKEGPVLLYIIRFEDSRAVDTFFNALHGHNTISHSFEGLSRTESIMQGQNNGKHMKTGWKGGAKTARNDGSLVGTGKNQDDENMTTGGKINTWKDANGTSETTNFSYLNEMFLGESANPSGVSQPPADSQWTFLAFSGSKSDTHYSQTNGASSRHRDDMVNTVQAVLQQRNKVGTTQTFVQYQPPVGHYRVAPRRGQSPSMRRSRMAVDARPRLSYPHRGASMPPDNIRAPSESSLASVSSEVTLRCSVTPTYEEVDSELAYLEDRRRRRGMYRSYRCRDQDSVFYGDRMSPESQMLDQLVRQTFQLRRED
ncbi:unnamed protein product [Schistocephalus solidus]|uniref:DUF5734 domain-containing protein n=2 Tax=Schistocephalus solidus TaxID=70667 RepID=A0A183S7E9_SCHSO|nr:unnamed protein product [Schistocephalus solidus]